MPGPSYLSIYFTSQEHTNNILSAFDTWNSIGELNPALNLATEKNLANKNINKNKHIHPLMKSVTSFHLHNSFDDLYVYFCFLFHLASSTCSAYLKVCNCVGVLADPSTLTNSLGEGDSERNMKFVAAMETYWVCINKVVLRYPGPWFNIKMSSYQYRKSHCGDKTVVRSSYLHNGISYTGKMSSLYWIGAQVVRQERAWLHGMQHE